MAGFCYQDRYLPASFGGVSFTAIDATSEHGRRGDEGEFIFGEDTAYADLGRRIRTYTIRARMQENTHIADTNRLIAVCEARGPHTLVHPTRGVILQVACRRARVSDRIEQEGGITFVDLDLVEANQVINGVPVVLFQGALDATPFLSTIGGWFGDNLNTGAVQTYRIGGIEQIITGITETTATTFSQATVGLRDDTRRYQALVEINGFLQPSLTTLGADDYYRVINRAAAAIVRFGGSGAFDLLRTLTNSASFTTGFAAPAQDTVSAIQTMVRLVGAVQMTQAALGDDASVASEVLSRMSVIDAVLAQEIEIARDDCETCLAEAIKTFRTGALSSLFSRAYDANAESVYSFAGQTSPLAAAYAIHCDARRHREIERMNPVGTMGLIGPDVLGRAA